MVTHIRIVIVFTTRPRCEQVQTYTVVIYIVAIHIVSRTHIVIVYIVVVHYTHAAHTLVHTKAAKQPAPKSVLSTLAHSQAQYTLYTKDPAVRF